MKLPNVSPVAVVVIGGGLVGGIYLASRMRAPAEAAPAGPVGVSYQVDSASSVEASDQLSRDYDAAQGKLRALEEAQARERQQLTERLDQVTRTGASEREQFLARLEQQQGQLTSQFAQQRMALEAQLKALQDQLNARNANPQPTGTVKLPETSPKAPAPAPAPAPSTTPAGRTFGAGYPGIQPHWVMQCGTTNRALYFAHPEDISRAGGRESVNSTFERRNQMAAAWQGTYSPWIGAEASIYNNPAADWGKERINNLRVRNGLYPLKSAQFDQIVAYLQSRGWWRDPWPLEGILYVWNNYNIPYRCGNYRG